MFLIYCKDSSQVSYDNAKIQQENTITFEK